MIEHQFVYTRAGPFLRPIIPITLRNEGVEFDYLALVDSGADFNMFHSDIAEILGIDLTKLKTMTFTGVRNGANGKAYYCVMDIGIKGSVFHSPVMFSPDISDKGYGILGELGFFNLFRIAFDYQQNDIRLWPKAV